jgi:cell division septum initiation protein DivIVA
MSDLVDELNAEAARITQYTNRGGDGLLHAAADRIEQLERELAEEKSIVDRIWDQLGRPSYEALKGRSIYDLIDELKSELADLRIKMAGCSREYESLLAEARTELSAVIGAAEEWAEYVTEDNAPRTISAHINRAIDAARKP